MQVITKLDEIPAGAKLAKDVVDVKGRLLLGAGTAIESRHLRILQTWSIQSVVIAEDIDHVEALPCSKNPSEVMSLESEIEAKFVLNDPEHPMVRRLMLLAQREANINS